MKFLLIQIVFGAALLAGCQSEGSGPFRAEIAADNGVSALARVNENGQRCWIKGGDRAFRGLALIPELDTTAGKPRLLLVKKGKAGGLPQLVIEASGDPVTLESYGPLASTSASRQFNADIIRWARGDETC